MIDGHRYLYLDTLNIDEVLNVDVNKIDGLILHPNKYGGGTYFICSLDNDILPERGIVGRTISIASTFTLKLPNEDWLEVMKDIEKLNKQMHFEDVEIDINILVLRLTQMWQSTWDKLSKTEELVTRYREI